MGFIISQILGVIITILAVISTQVTSIKWILIIGITTNTLSGINYLIQGGSSALWVCVIAAVQSVVMYFVNQMEMEKRKKGEKWVFGIFLTLYFISFFATLQSWADIIPLVCALLFMMAVLQKDALHYKYWIIFNPMCWIAYELYVRTYTMILLRITLIVSTSISIYLIRKKQKQEKEQKKSEIVD